MFRNPNGDYENYVIKKEFNLDADKKKFWLGRIESMSDKGRINAYFYESI